jgi:hypothetical protein
VFYQMAGCIFGTFKPDTPLMVLSIMLLAVHPDFSHRLLSAIMDVGKDSAAGERAHADP